MDDCWETKFVTVRNRMNVNVSMQCRIPNREGQIQKMFRQFLWNENVSSKQQVCGIREQQK